jgi:hypothetical protein
MGEVYLYSSFMTWTGDTYSENKRDPEVTEIPLVISCNVLVIGRLLISVVSAEQVKYWFAQNALLCFTGLRITKSSDPLLATS